MQAEAILNLRLRALRRLEEMELKREYDALMAERAEIEDLLADVGLQWNAVSDELRATKKQFGKDHPRGHRLSRSAEAGTVEDVPMEAMIEREPVTVVCSQMGWIRAMKGHVDLDAELKFKDGDGPLFTFHAETTDKLLLVGSMGRVYTIPVSNLPGGRGMGEPVRLMIDLPNEAQIVSLRIHRPGERLLVVSSAGDGFILPEDEAIAQTRAGRQVLNVKAPVVASVVRPVQGDHVAAVGRIANCSSSRWKNCRKWGAARAFACNGSKTAVCRMRSPSRSPKACHGPIPQAAPAP